jgi:hypothetical protein
MKISKTILIITVNILLFTTIFTTKLKAELSTQNSKNIYLIELIYINLYFQI